MCVEGRVLTLNLRTFMPAITSISGFFGNSAPYLSKEGHSEVCAQQPFAAVHHLHHLRVGPVEGVVQVSQFL